MRYIFVSLVLTLTPFMASAEDIVARSYTLQKHGTLQLKVPESWNDSFAQPTSDLPPTIKFSPKNGAQFTILATPIWLTQPDIKSPSADELRANVRQAADIALMQSMEDSIEVKELKGPTNTGYYFTATDQAPQPGEFKNLNQGVIAVNDLLVSFTILTNDGQEAIVKEALSLLSSAEHR